MHQDSERWARAQRRLVAYACTPRGACICIAVGVLVLYAALAALSVRTVNAATANNDPSRMKIPFYDSLHI